MRQVTKDQQGRERLREYEARVDAARSSVAVLARFAQAREARGGDAALEVGFAATPADPDAPMLPAAVWVALRQDDIEAVIDTLVQLATEQFLIAEHEQLDAGYRLTTVAECRGLPDADLLVAQLAAFVDVPRDVIAMVCGWGPDDPRTLVEIERLMDQRYDVRRSAADGPTAARTPDPTAPRPMLTMTSGELAALLSLTPEQQATAATLVRQADVVVTADPAATG